MEQLMAGTASAAKANVNKVTHANRKNALVVSTSAMKRPRSGGDRSVTFAESEQREQYERQQEYLWREEEPPLFERTRLEESDGGSAFSTDQSSIMLTPLNRVRVRVMALPTTDSSDSETMMGPQPRVELRGF
jgi:hypothetical protein